LGDEGKAAGGKPKALAALLSLEFFWKCQAGKISENRQLKRRACVEGVKAIALRDVRFQG